MPGLVGIISLQEPDRNRADLELMTRAMIHERSYRSGTLVDTGLGVYVGWACHEGSFADCLPIWNANKDRCLLFYGETFAEDGLLDSLRRKGYQGPRDRATYLLDHYEYAGAGFFSQLNGFFSGLLLDLPRREVTLFNDRYGMQRVYCLDDRTRFLFASEAKSILKVSPDARGVVPACLGQLVSMGCVLDNKTLFPGVHLLPGASAWRFGGAAGPKRERYFTPKEWESQPALGKEPFYERLKETFVRILPKYLNDTRPTAMSLTGGLDTRMIMACAQSPRGQLPCYTFGSMFRDSFDVKVARQVAAACGQQHRTIRIDREFLGQFPALAEKAIYIADGGLDVFDATELYVNRKAREIAPVRITGNYGSEVLRSIRAFKPRMPGGDVFSADLLLHARQAAGVFSHAVEGHALTFTAFKQAPWFNFNRLSLEQSQLTMRTPFMDDDLVRLVYQAPPEAVNSDEMSLRLVADGNPVLSRIITNRGVGQTSGQLVSRCRQRWFEFLRLAEFGWDYGMPQWVSRLESHLAPLHLERLFLGRHKFYHFRLWFRHELAGYVKQVCLDPRTLGRPYLNRRVVEKVVREHVDGRKNYTREINKIITCELLHRLFV